MHSGEQTHPLIGSVIRAFACAKAKTSPWASRIAYPGSPEPANLNIYLCAEAEGAER